MLGFGAIGVWDVGGGPLSSASVTFTLVASNGTFTLTGNASAFTFNVPETGAQAFALTGIAETFKTSEALAVGSFTETGVAVTFNLLDVVSAGGYTFTGIATPDTISEPVAPPGSFALTGVATTFTLQEAFGTGTFTVSTSTSGITLEADSAGAFALTGIDAALSVFLFGGAGDGGKSHNIEDDWAEYARKHDELRNSIRRARRRVNGELTSDPTSAPAPRRRVAPLPPFEIPHVNLDISAVTATLSAISANLSTLETALQPPPPAPVAPNPPPPSVEAVAAPAHDDFDEDAAITALLMAA